MVLRHYDIEYSLPGLHENSIARPWSGSINAGFPGGLNCRSDNFDLLSAKKPVFAGMGVDTGDGNLGMSDSQLNNTHMSKFNSR